MAWCNYSTCCAATELEQDSVSAHLQIVTSVTADSSVRPLNYVTVPVAATLSPADTYIWHKAPCMIVAMTYLVEASRTALRRARMD